ncbi:T9SS type A sorting domain-containing protein [Nonlabens agnitus]|uniref:Secretion system C-terminal sorting domain-containing protein n=1 Tax=Nonlabens agnitus TaxID=870484 RepID=A0A2S9WUL7_9FLAO|nr:T9SS type A sorting domain-containing protein [Nonlabens agnitus]PRP67172.1 hypothetical protein BST86_08705 [Nonlabens agnitus]
MLKITFLLLFAATIATAQDLTLTSTSSLSINDGGSLYINGAELDPSVNYDLVGPNEVTTTKTALTSPRSINKVIEWSSPVEDYQGMIYFHYGNQDLNQLEESSLGLIIRDVNSEWIGLDSNLDQGSRTIGFGFSSPTNISGISVSEKQTASSNSFDSAQLQLYPNPTTSTLTLEYNSEVETEIYNLQGSSLFKTSEKKIDFSNLSSGVYLIKITDQQTQDSIYKKIIKK